MNYVEFADLPMGTVFLMEAVHERCGVVYHFQFKDNDNWYDCTRMPTYSGKVVEDHGGSMESFKKYLPIWKYPTTIKSCL